MKMLRQDLNWLKDTEQDVLIKCLTEILSTDIKCSTTNVILIGVSAVCRVFSRSSAQGD